MPQHFSFHTGLAFGFVTALTIGQTSFAQALTSPIAQSSDAPLSVTTEQTTRIFQANQDQVTLVDVALALALLNEPSASGNGVRLAEIASSLLGFPIEADSLNPVPTLETVTFTAANFGIEDVAIILAASNLPTNDRTLDALRQTANALLGATLLGEGDVIAIPGDLRSPAPEPTPATSPEPSRTPTPSEPIPTPTSSPEPSRTPTPSEPSPTPTSSPEPSRTPTPSEPSPTPMTSPEPDRTPTPSEPSPSPTPATPNPGGPGIVRVVNDCAVSFPEVEGEGATVFIFNPRPANPAPSITVGPATLFLAEFPGLPTPESANYSLVEPGRFEIAAGTTFEVPNLVPGTTAIDAVFGAQLPEGCDLELL